MWKGKYISEEHLHQNISNIKMKNGAYWQAAVCSVVSLGVTATLLARATPLGQHQAPRQPDP